MTVTDPQPGTDLDLVRLARGGDQRAFGRDPRNPPGLARARDHELRVPADARLGNKLEPLHIKERGGTILEDGKPLVASQTTDPSSDRVVKVEMKATILK